MQRPDLRFDNPCYSPRIEVIMYNGDFHAQMTFVEKAISFLRILQRKKFLRVVWSLGVVLRGYSMQLPPHLLTFTWLFHIFVSILP